MLLICAEHKCLEESYLVTSLPPSPYTYIGCYELIVILFSVQINLDVTVQDPLVTKLRWLCSHC